MAPPGQNLVQNGPETIDVGMPLDQVKASGGLLRCHEGGRTHRLAMHRETGFSPTRQIDHGRRTARVCFLIDELGQAPIQYDDLAEVSQHHVLTFEISVDHPSGVRVRDGVADSDEGIHQGNEIDRFCLSVDAALVPQPCRLAERAALDEAHGVKGLVIGGSFSQLIDGHDTWVFQLAGDTSFQQEPRSVSGKRRAFGPQFLESDSPTESIVAGDPDLPDAATRMQTGEFVSFLRSRDGLVDRHQGGRRIWPR
jgi:hypothetical protein